MLRFQRLNTYFRRMAVFTTMSIACMFMFAVQGQEEDSGAEAASMSGHEAGEEGKRLYQGKEYDAALPYLQVAAEWGFKDAQARLGQVYLKGLGDVEKNTLRGLAWLGTAASKPSSSGYENLYSNALADVPEDKVGDVEATVDAYMKRFGSGAAAVECKMVKPLGSNMSQLSCDYDKRFDYSGDPGSAWSMHEGAAF